MGTMARFNKPSKYHPITGNSTITCYKGNPIPPSPPEISPGWYTGKSQVWPTDGKLQSYVKYLRSLGPTGMAYVKPDADETIEEVVRMLLFAADIAELEVSHYIKDDVVYFTKK